MQGQTTKRECFNLLGERWICPVAYNFALPGNGRIRAPPSLPAERIGTGVRLMARMAQTLWKRQGQPAGWGSNPRTSVSSTMSTSARAE